MGALRRNSASAFQISRKFLSRRLPVLLHFSRTPCARPHLFADRFFVTMHLESAVASPPPEILTPPHVAPVATRRCSLAASVNRGRVRWDYVIPILTLHLLAHSDRSSLVVQLDRGGVPGAWHQCLRSAWRTDRLSSPARASQLPRAKVARADVRDAGFVLRTKYAGPLGLLAPLASPAYRRAG